jgi:hypothetical protein
MPWKVSEHVWDFCCGSTTAQFYFCFVSSTGLGFCFFFFADMLSDLKLYYLVTLQFVSGLIQIVSMDKFCIIPKKIQVRFKTKAFNNFLWKIHSMLLLQYFKTQT